MKDYDDKDLVILSVLLICIAVVAIPYCSNSAIELVEKALYGLFGIAIGKGIK